MDFKKATDQLMVGMTRGQIAKALGKSEASIRQARLPENNAARRSPPHGWEGAVADLAETQGKRLLKLSQSLQRQAR